MLMRGIFGAAIVASLIAPAATYAQFGFSLGPSLSIGMQPAYPAPGDTVHLTATSDSGDLGSTELSWSIDGKPLGGGSGATSISIVAGALGSRTNVRVSAQTSDGLASAAVSITPAYVDLIFDSDAYVPPFYEGRSLPSPSSSLRIEAIPWLPAAGGGIIPKSQLSYTWRRGGTIIANASGRGRSSIVTTAPTLYGTDTISVEVTDAGKTIASGGSIRIPSREPVLRLYEDHPVFGLLLHNALSTDITADDTEETFAAVPFYARARSTGDPRLSYAWRVNGKGIAADAAQPDELTINGGDSGGTAQIDLMVTNSADLYMESSGSWRASFVRAGTNAGSSNSPFRSNAN